MLSMKRKFCSKIEVVTMYVCVCVCVVCVCVVKPELTISQR